LEPSEKIYVNPSFVKTLHGEIACEACHDGDPRDPNWQTAHKEIIRDPTFPNADKACGQCHENLVTTAKNSLHYTLAPFGRVIRTRANKKDKRVLEKVCQAKAKHCRACHASCGQCHVSRPNYVEGGFLAGHFFQKRPPMDTTCASCHGARVYAEFTGANEAYPPDVHYEKEGMDCMDCHTGNEMHTDATGVASRFDLPERPRCKKCHPDVVPEKPKTNPHTIHMDKVACQVCHALANKNCYNCHVGTDKEGLAYFKSSEARMLFKIGLNPNKTKDRPYNYVVLRHPPADPGLFDFYVNDGLSDFDKLPTWKLDTPHNIQRITPQNKTCNNCHGNASLFLQKKDVTEWEQKPNARVVVPEAKVPKPIIPQPAVNERPSPPRPHSPCIAGPW
jgi:thiosulfate/3-mercaptopyruvate sulfurtransferase